MDDKLLADMLRKHGNTLVEKAVNKLTTSGATTGGKPVKKRASIVDRIAGAALMRIASRSVPGAILVGGGLLAKHLHDRHRAKKDAQASEAATDKPTTGPTTSRAKSGK